MEGKSNIAKEKLKMYNVELPDLFHLLETAPIQR